MINVEWNESIEIGIPIIDAQHKVLFDLIKTLDGHVHQDSGTEAVANVIEKLIRYAAEHFSAEEKMMLSFRYPDLASHSKLHDLFISRVEGIQGDFNRGQQVNDSILDFLMNWLITHIMGADQEYNRFMSRAP
ncbi:MAG: bacteriohemerythrin [Desulfuromonadaceae bacterium]|nr:bacteriohemerythrin [Desulfuromonadaceae bacterium]MDD5105448.1 bacteriohemerythrin [Desulfuromonadaceae bacterium]